jgi:alpha,alpha-trehalase
MSSNGFHCRPAPARDGGFALVIGISGTGSADDLARSGADVVVADLADVAIRTGDKRISELPNALTSYGQLIGITSARESMLFLDYIGDDLGDEDAFDAVRRYAS